MTTQAPDKKSYKETLNLPQTKFPMEAKLTANEPLRLDRWRKDKLYEAIQESRSKDRLWILHDGPPFANGDIHMGHVINKTLKDVFLRFKTMQGFRTPYVPGWDCHGLPIEHKIQTELGPKLRELSTVEVRQRCYAYADKYVKIQSEQFQRLGILGDWANPYLTMSRDYEAATLEVFARFVEAGLVYKQLKPVHWSIENQTALAEAELEYREVDDDTVYVEFASADAALASRLGLAAGVPISFLAWTTTPWTLPANLAIAVHPNVDYAFVQYERNGKPRIGVVAAALTERVFANRAGVTSHNILKTIPGRDLVGQKYRHPFIDRAGTILPAEYVTTTDGTGLVHTAPGHGEDDYLTGVANKLDIYCPVQADGRFDATAPEWLRGKTVWQANPLVIEKLKEGDVLLASEKVRHTYPHDWRGKKPTIFRATEQWFIALDKPFTPQGAAGEPRTLRQRALDACREVTFIPAFGQARIVGMLESRPDWCISRQRAWGMPIPVFYNEDGQPLLSGDSVRAVAKYFRANGSDAWFTAEPATLLADFAPPGFDKQKLRKERDIFDVWFESGNSWHAVVQARPELHFPADLYLEGSDQHRGWFQLSLLPSLGFTGSAPFKSVLTHGFIVKPDGTKVSKSDKEYVTATKEVDTHGADVLRLWCCSVDYQGDMPASPQAMKDFADKYRKIRNTVRYLLSNLYDFDPARDEQPVPDNSLDGYAMDRVDALVREVTAAYEAYQLHRAFRLLYDFCAVDISALYGNAMKDRLYCDLPNSPLRRRCQTAMHRVALALVKLLAPMVVYTADEAWEHIVGRPAGEAELPSVHMAKLPQPRDHKVSESARKDWALLMDLRSEALLQLDRLTRQIGKYKALDAEVIYKIDPATRKRLEPFGPDLEDIVGAGFHSFVDAAPGAAPTVELVDRRETYKACARSWKRRPDVGQDPRYPDLCARDAAAMATISASR